MFDQKELAEIREDFPILERKHPNGKPLVYLDNAATTQKPRTVIKKICETYEKHNANPHRGAHFLSQESTEIYENARREIAKFLGASRVSEAVLCGNTTDALNHILYGFALDYLKPGDVILLTIMEHHADLCTWQYAAEKTKAELRYIYLNDDLTLNEAELAEKLDQDVKMFCLTGCSNVTACSTDYVKYFKKAKELGAVTVLDAAQTAPWRKIDFKNSNADFLACSAHKMLGPTGAGVLLGRKELLEQMRPIRYGGDMVRRVYEDHTEYAAVPSRFEGGTQDVAAFAGFAEALRYLKRIGIEKAAEHECALADYCEELLRKIDGVSVYRADQKDAGPLVSFNIKDVHPHDVAGILDYDGIAIRAGHHCAEPLHEYLGIKTSCRASFSFYNSEEEVEYLAKAVAGVRSKMGLS